MIKGSKLSNAKGDYPCAIKSLDLIRKMLIQSPDGSALSVSGQDLCCAESCLSEESSTGSFSCAWWQGVKHSQLWGSPLCLWERRTVQPFKCPGRELVVRFELDAGRLCVQ